MHLCQRDLFATVKGSSKPGRCSTSWCRTVQDRPWRAPSAKNLIRYRPTALALTVADDRRSALNSTIIQDRRQEPARARSHRIDLNKAARHHDDPDRHGYDDPNMFERPDAGKPRPASLRPAELISPRGGQTNSRRRASAKHQGRFLAGRELFFEDWPPQMPHHRTPPRARWSPGIILQPVRRVRSVDQLISDRPSPGERPSR